MKPRRENKRTTKAERRRQRNRLVSILTAAVVFFTTYAMVLPAITMEEGVAAQEPGIEISQPAPEPVAAEPVAEVVQEPAPLVAEPVAVEPAAAEPAAAEPVVSDQTVTEIQDSQVPTPAPEAEATPAPEAGEADTADAAQDAIVSSSSNASIEEQETVVEETPAEENADDAEKEDPEEEDSKEEEEEENKLAESPLVYDGSDFVARVSFGPEAALPEGTMLIISEYSLDSNDYLFYKGQLFEKLKENGVTEENLEEAVAALRLFGVVFKDKDGVRILPASAVDVEIEYKNAAQTVTNETLQAVTFRTDDGQPTKATLVSGNANGRAAVEAPQGFVQKLYVQAWQAQDYHTNPVIGQVMLRTIEKPEEATEDVVDLITTEDTEEAEEQEEIVGVGADSKPVQAEDGSFCLYLTYGPEAEIPEDAKFVAIPVTEDHPDYAAYKERALGAVDGQNETSPVLLGLFDLTIYDANDNVINPKAPITIRADLGTAMDAVEDVFAVHFVDSSIVAEEEKATAAGAELEVLTVDSADGAATFEADGLSVIGIVGTELITEVTLPGSDDTYEVSVTYGPDAKIPENVHLEVTAFAAGSTEYIEAKEAVVAAKMDEDEEFDEKALGFAALDISIVDDGTGEKIEPAEGAQVRVSFKMKKLPEGENESNLDETMEIQHLNVSTGSVIVETVAGATDIDVADGLAETEFTVDSFSTFSVTWSNASNTSTNLRWRYNNNNTRGQVTVNYVNSDGVAITRPTGINGNYDIAVTNGDFTNEVMLSSENVARDINGRTREKAYIIIDGNQQEITRVVAARHTSGSGWSQTTTYSMTYYNGSEQVYTNSGTGSTSYTRPDVYLQYSSLSNDGMTATVYYVDESGNELPIKNLEATYTDLGSNSYSPAYLIYDIENYEYSYTYRNENTTTNRIRPLLQKNNSGTTWQYRRTGNNTSWTDLSDEDKIYVVYKRKAIPTTGGTPDVNPDETWPDEEEPDPDVPTFTKSSKNQEDGTNLISLSIKGSEKEVTEATPADVIVVFDKSWSMDLSNVGSKNRLVAAKDATNEMAKMLIGPDVENHDVQMALVTFGTDASVDLGLTNDYDTFTSTVDRITAGNTQRTNWEKGLYLANTSTDLGLRENAATFVVFVTDGDPTMRMSRGDYTNEELGSIGMTEDYYTNNYLFGDGSPSNAVNVDACYVPAVPQVQAIVGSNKSFYAIGITQDAARLQKLMTDSGIRESNAILCEDDEALEQAFKSITEAIQMSLGFGGVQIKDGITALTNMQLKKSMQTVDETSFKYYRYGGANDKYGADEAHKTEWTTRAADGCNAASYNHETGCVEWNMGDGFQLEDGVTYMVTFRVWPSQEAYDLIADLNNGVREYETLDQAIKDQINEVEPPDLEEGTPGSYTLNTNTDPLTAKYKRTTKTGGVVSIPDPESSYDANISTDNEDMDLTSQLLTIKKIFDESLDPRAVDSVTLTLQRKVNDDDHTMADYNVPGTVSPNFVLNNDNEWETSFYVAPGFIVDGETLELGYQFTVTEPEQYLGTNTVRYDLIPEIVNPMVVNGTLELKGDEDGNQALTAINRTRSAVEIHKTLYDVDGTTEIYPDTEFTITGKLLDPDGNAYTNQVQADPAAYYLYDRDGNATTGRLHFADSSNISFTLKAGEFIRFVNVPEGCTFEFQETSMPDNYELNSLAAVGRQRNPEIDPPYTYSIELSDTVAHLVEGETTISTTDEGIIGNTNYKLDFYNKRIIPLPDVELVKIDQDDSTKKLNGASFELHKDSVEGSPVTVDGNGNAINITTGNKEGSTGPDGWYHIGLLPAGTYYMVETNPPIGYVHDETPIIITVTKVDDSYSVTAAKDGTSVITGPVDGLYTITVSNKKATKYIRVFKYETGTTIPLEGAEFSLTGPEGTNISYLEKTTNAEGYLEFDTDGTTIIELPGANNAYTLNETEAPAGYNKIAENISFTVNTDGVSGVGSAYEVVEESATLDGKNITVYTIKVANSAGVELPMTGGSGTLPYTLGGIGLIMASALMYIFRMRRRERRLK